MDSWSMESLVPLLPEDCMFKQYSLTCYQTISLADIWIPSHVLLESSKALSCRRPKKAQFHVLEKDDAHQKIPRFSVYTDSDTFENESDEDIILNSRIDSCETIEDSVEKLPDKFLANAETVPVLIDEDIILNSRIDSYETIEDSVGKLPDKFLANAETVPIQIDEDIILNSRIDSSETIEDSVGILPDDKFLANAETVPVQIDATINGDSVSVTSESPKPEKNNTAEQKKSSSKNQLKLSPKIAAAIYDDSDEDNVDKNDASASSVSNSQNSLNDILDTTPQFDATKFPLNEDIVDILMPEFSMKLVSSNKGFDEGTTDFTITHKKAGSAAKKHNKKERQLKKKAAKVIPINAFEDNDSDPQNDDRDCLAFVESVRRRNYFANGLHLNNTADFPDLVKQEIVFNKPDVPKTKYQPEIGIQSVVDILVESSKSEENSNESSVAENVSESEVIARSGKIVIENIPKDVVEEDIKNLLDNYGVITDLIIKRSGQFLSASVSMNFHIDFHDIGWIVDCLDGTNAFGASNDTLLRCYCVTESNS